MSKPKQKTKKYLEKLAALCHVSAGSFVFPAFCIQANVWYFDCI